jgi:hypothetical protein
VKGDRKPCASKKCGHNYLKHALDGGRCLLCECEKYKATG